MLNHFEAQIAACGAIAKLFGLEYFKSHIQDACRAYPPKDIDEVDYEYFLGFEDDSASGLWTVFARVTVNRETKQVQFLDYKTPDGHRMENPIKPISFA